MSRQSLTPWRADGVRDEQMHLQRAVRLPACLKWLLLTVPSAIQFPRRRLRTPQKILEQGRNPHKQQLSRLQPLPAARLRQIQDMVRCQCTGHCSCLAEVS